MDKIQKDREPGLLKYEERKKTLFAAQKWVENFRGAATAVTACDRHIPPSVCAYLCGTMFVCVVCGTVCVSLCVWLALPVAFDTSS